MYSIDFPDGKVFQDDEAIPAGFVDTPGKVFVTEDAPPPKKRRTRKKTTVETVVEAEQDAD